MNVYRKWVVRLAVILALVATVSFLVSNQVRSSQPAAGDDQATDGRAPCPDVACVSNCWADGTVENRGTKVKKTQFSDCGINQPGCLTQACGH